MTGVMTTVSANITETGLGCIIIGDDLTADLTSLNGERHINHSFRGRARPKYSLRYTRRNREQRRVKMIKVMVSAGIGLGLALSGAAVALADDPPPNPNDINYSVSSCSGETCSTVPTLVKSATTPSQFMQSIAAAAQAPAPPPTP